MKYNFTYDTSSLIITLDTENGKYKQDVMSLNNPSIILGNNSISVHDSGVFKNDFRFLHIGTIDGQTPSDVIDASNKIQTIINQLYTIKASTNGGAIIPSSTPQGTGSYYWTAVEAGTYANFGGFILANNEFAIVVRDAVGAFSVSKTGLDLSTYQKIVDGNKINPWTAKAYNSGDQVNYLGKDWVSNAATVAGDVPGISGKWLVRLTAYENKADLVVGKNLFNYLDSNIKRGFFLTSTGTANPFITGYDWFSVTGFIPVTSGQTLICNKTNAGSNTYNCFYDANKVFISAVTTATMVVPTGAAYVRYTLLLPSTADIISAAIQVELGTVSTTYSPYKLVVPASELELTDYIKGTEAVAILSPTIDTKIQQNNLAIGEYINLFNKDTITVGYFPNKNTGILQANTYSLSASDYMPVTGGLSYYNGSNDTSQSACYDSNKVFISGFSTKVMVMPANAAYVRIMVGSAYLETAYFTKGTAGLATYIPYKYTIKPENINFPTATNYSNKIACPLKQHFLSTIENNIYLDEFQKRKLQIFPISTTPSVGSRKNDIIRATNPPVGTYSIPNALVDLDYVDVHRKDYSIVVSNLSKTTPINVLSIGDSYTDIGTYVKKMGETLPNINHIGMCKSVSGTDVKREGRSGWTLASYATQNGSTAGTGFFSPFLHPIDPYKYYGNTDFWKKVYIGTAPGYEINTFKPWLTTLNINSSGVKATPTVNDVMYFTVDSAFKYWDGTAWTVISSATLGFTFNFPKYLTTWSIPTPDVITVLLGMNDFRSQSLSTFSTFFITWKSQMDSLIASAKLANANVKIVIATCNSTEYNDLSGKANAALWEGYNAVITAYDNREAENIFISDTKVAVDRVYGYAGTKAIPFSNYTGSETIWYTGGDVHINTGGMNQIGEKLAATIQYVRP